MKFCRKQLTNKAIKKSLVAVENIPVLEDLLDRNIQQHKRLEDLKHNDEANFLKEIEAGDLAELALRTYGEVDNFLDFKPSVLPEILYKPRGEFEYFPKQKIITVETLQRIILIPGIAHEYAHHVQHSKRLWHDCYDIFSEGHARGVEKQIAENHGRKEGNELFLYDISEETLGELTIAYVWACRKLDKKHRWSLLKVNMGSIKESLKLLIKGTPSKYAMGNALFSIYETIYGKDVYKETLNCR